MVLEVGKKYKLKDGQIIEIGIYCGTTSAWVIHNQIRTLFLYDISGICPDYPQYDVLCMAEEDPPNLAQSFTQPDRDARIKDLLQQTANEIAQKQLDSGAVGITVPTAPPQAELPLREPKDELERYVPTLRRLTGLEQIEAEQKREAEAYALASATAPLDLYEFYMKYCIDEI